MFYAICDKCRKLYEINDISGNDTHISKIVLYSNLKVAGWDVANGKALCKKCISLSHSDY